MCTDDPGERSEDSKLLDQKLINDINFHLKNQLKLYLRSPFPVQLETDDSFRNKDKCPNISLTHFYTA